MSIVTRIANLWQGKAATPFSPAWNASWLAAAGKNPWNAGKASPEALSAVYSAARLLTGGLLGSSVRLVRANRDGGSERIGSGDLAAVLADLPTHHLEPCFNDMLLKGNGYLRVYRNDRGGIMGLEWLEAARCSLERKNGTRDLWLKVNPRWADAEKTEMLPQGEYIHLAMRPSASPIYGESPLSRLSPGMEMAVAVIQSASELMKNSVNPGAILTIKAGLKPEARERLRETLSRTFAPGGQNSGKTLLLDVENSLDRFPTAEAMLSEAFVQLANFSVGEVARAFGVPVSLLAQGQDVNRSTAEQESRSFAMFSVQPLARMVADQMSRALISEQDRRGGLRIQFDLTDALIPVGVERAEYASKLLSAGLASTNELRDYLGLGDVAGGDMLAKPSNTVPLDHWLEGPQASQPAPVPAPAQSPSQDAQAAPQKMISKDSTAPTESEIAEAGLRLIVNRSRDEAVFKASLGSDPVAKLISRSM